MTAFFVLKTEKTLIFTLIIIIFFFITLIMITLIKFDHYAMVPEGRLSVCAGNT